MKKLTPVLGLAGVVLASLSASAQPVFQYNDGDLVLDFSKAGSADLEVDIGSSSSFIALAGGGAVPVSGYNISSQLLSTFGGSLDGVSFSVFGTTSSTSADYLSLRRLNPSVANTVPADFSGAKASSVSGDVNGLIGFGTSTGILPYSAGTPADSVGNTATAVVIPTSGVAAVNSFTTKYNGTGGLKSLLATPGAANTLAGNFAETPGATAASDLFDATAMEAVPKHCSWENLRWATTAPWSSRPSRSQPLMVWLPEPVCCWSCCAGNSGADNSVEKLPQLIRSKTKNQTHENLP